MKIDLSIFKNSKMPILPIILGVGIVICLVLIIPQVMNSMRTLREVLQKKAILKNIDCGIENFAAFEDELQLLNSLYEDYFNRLPPQKEFPVFLELISALAKKNNIKIIAIEPQAMIDNPDLFYMEFPVLIDALCGYHDLGRFINNLEDAKIFMKIKDIKIANDDIIPKQHNVFLNISTFCLKEVEDENVSN